MAPDHFSHEHYRDVTMSAIASQITSLTIVCSTVYLGADKRKHQSSVSLAFVKGIHRRAVNSPHKGPVTRKNVSIWWRHHEVCTLVYIVCFIWVINDDTWGVWASIWFIYQYYPGHVQWQHQPITQHTTYITQCQDKCDDYNIISMGRLHGRIGTLPIQIMMTSSNGSIFCVTGPLCGEFIGHRWIPRKKTSDAPLWCFLWSAPWINIWVNNRKAGDLRRHRAHNDVIVMFLSSHCCAAMTIFSLWHGQVFTLAQVYGGWFLIHALISTAA